MPTTPQDAPALGVLVKERRLAIGRTIDEAARNASGMSPVTWARVEQGHPVRALTLRGVEQALGWTSGSCFRFLTKGELPTVDPAAADPPHLDPLTQYVHPRPVGSGVDPALLAEIEHLSDAQVQRVRDFLKGIKGS